MHNPITFPLVAGSIYHSSKEERPVGRYTSRPGNEVVVVVF